MNSISGFGDRLRAARKNAKLTQKELAEKVGAKHNSVSDWENNKNMPDPDTIVLLCNHLTVSPSYLLNTEASAEVEADKLYGVDVSHQNVISAKAQKIAREYDGLSNYAKAIIDCVLEQEKRFGKVMFTAVPIIGEAKQDGTVEMKEAARRELEGVKEEDLIVLKPDLI